MIEGKSLSNEVRNITKDYKKGVIVLSGFYLYETINRVKCYLNEN